MNRNYLSVTVSGGTPTENEQMVNMLHTFMVQNGFTHVVSPRNPDSQFQPGPSLADLIRSQNPELFDTPVYLNGECEDDVIMQEGAALLGMMRQFGGHQMTMAN